MPNININTTADELTTAIQLKDSIMRGLISNLQQVNANKQQLEKNIQLIANDIARDQSMLTQLEEVATTKTTK